VISLLPRIVGVGLVILVPSVLLGVWAGRRHYRRLTEAQRAAQTLPPRERTETLDRRREADLARVVAAHALRDAWVRDGCTVAGAREVTMVELLADPVAFHADEGALAWGTHHVRATGLWLYPRARREAVGLPGFGHMATSPGCFHVAVLEHLTA
jgi:hypothetical protein